ncbi:Non-specific lipid-transfer protein 11-like protein [Drosera capensis]
MSSATHKTTSIVAIIVTIVAITFAFSLVEADVTAFVTKVVELSCAPYLVNGTAPECPCCTLLATLDDRIDNTVACSLLQSAVSTVAGRNWSYAKTIHNHCGVPAGYPLTKSFDCSLSPAPAYADTEMRV